MIYTLTLNPSLDYIIYTDNYREGKVNRTVSESLVPGGKGINVSRVLKNLGCESIALGFVGGFVGAEIERLLAADGIRTRTVRRLIFRCFIKSLMQCVTEIFLFWQEMHRTRVCMRI